MCWNISVSCVFGSVCFGFAAIYYRLRHNRQFREHWKPYMWFALYYGVMEFFEMAQWLFGDLQSSVPTPTSSPTGCSVVNRRFTYMAQVLVWGQPILYSCMGWMASEGRESKRSMFRRLCYINVAVLLWAVLSTQLVETGALVHWSHVGHVQIPGAVSTAPRPTMCASSTCSTIGRKHHLVWNFRALHLDYQPNLLLFLVLCASSLFMYDRPLQPILWGYIMSLVLTGLLLRPTAEELPSAWCLLSVSANPIALVMHRLCHWGRKDPVLHAE